MIVEARLFLLQMAGVRQYHRAQINGGRRGIDRPLETFFDQPRNPAAVVKMGVRQNHGVNLARRNRSIFPVAESPFLWALKKAAVDEHLHARLMEESSRVLMRCFDPVTVPAAPRN